MRSLIFFTLFTPFFLLARTLEYAPAPVDNPLKGLVPYAAQWKKEERFPHSMEFQYFSFGEVMKGWGEFDWAPVEKALEKSKKGGRQFVFRVFLEYPGKPGAIPEFLLQDGMKVVRWTDGGGKEVVTPDYSDPVTRRAIRECIAALGKKYDGDPRVGFLTAGMLGSWGEWHSFPRNDLWASKEVQREVMGAFEKAFTKTPVLLRYPAGGSDGAYADNREAKFGYHDDSFAWATVETEKKGDEWFFMPKMKKAGALEKWKKFPIGGEIRPEIWPTTFTDQVTGQQQDFSKCIAQTHVSWLMDSGMFAEKFLRSEERTKRAKEAVRKMGYELHVSEARMVGEELVVKVENRGVAPFYYDWPIEVRVGEKTITPDWKLREVLPGEPVEWRMLLAKEGEVAIRVPNPMEGGRDLRFANAGYEEGWLLLLGNEDGG